MLVTDYFIIISLVLTSIYAHPWSTYGHHDCDFGKICAWDWGRVYTISESHPNVTSEGRLFQVSQKVQHHHGGEEKHDTPTNRVYTVINPSSFGGLGTDGCSLVFNIPCNNTTPIYHRGPIDIVVKALRYLPTPNPTWDNIVNANPPVIIDNVVGTVSDIHNGVRNFITTNACNMPPNDTHPAFIFEMAESVHQTAELKFEETLMNADIVTGVYFNFTC